MLILEDVDHAMPHLRDAQERVQEEGSNSTSKTQVLRDLILEVRKKAAHVLIIATARNKQMLNKELLTAPGTHTFDTTLEIQPLSLVCRVTASSCFAHCSVSIPWLSTSPA